MPHPSSSSDYCLCYCVGVACALQVQVVISDAATVNQVQLIILAVEGCVLSALAVFYMWFVASHIIMHRYSMYCVFMVMPQVRATEVDPPS